MYGSDFPFTLLEDTAVRYRDNFDQFVATVWPGQAEAPATEGIYWRNAARFLGLTRNARGKPSPTLERMIAFHADGILQGNEANGQKWALDRAEEFWQPFVP